MSKLDHEKTKYNILHLLQSATSEIRTSSPAREQLKSWLTMSQLCILYWRHVTWCLHFEVGDMWNSFCSVVDDVCEVTGSSLCPQQGTIRHNLIYRTWWNHWKPIVLLPAPRSGMLRMLHMWHATQTQIISLQNNKEQTGALIRHLPQINAPPVPASFLRKCD